MDDADAPESPLEAAAGAAGTQAIEAFSLLGNETRLSILLALWESYEPFADDTAVPFAELRKRVGIPQGAQFNYHLDKLVGHFVRKTDTGYELRHAGQQIVRTVIAGTGLNESTVERTELDDDCTVCGGQTVITYQDEFLYHICTHCEGYFGEVDEKPSGMLSAFQLNPAGLAGRTPEERFHAAVTTGYQAFESAIEGVCGTCSGTMAQSLHICSDHTSDGVCDSCGRGPAIVARFVCSVCKSHHQAPPYLLVAQHPAVIAFYYEQGVSLQYEVTDFEHEQQRRRPLKSHTQYLLDDDPPLIRVQIEHDGDQLELTLDADLNVIEVEESD